ncbi:MAG: phage head-tail connector protein [Firmicutes bacterium]|nr:phage head-tail connector protein [Bacillota bacterium]MBE3590829.1 phage head-tail connector protein [Bacillota bacterium]
MDGHWSLRVVTPPASEPVTLAEAKLHLRVDATDDDALISGLIRAAREHAEQILGRALMTQTLELGLDDWPRDEILLPMPPVQSVASISYTDAAGVVRTVDPASYVVDTASEPARVVLRWSYTWPADVLQPQSGAIRVRYVAGYQSAADIPQAIKAAILLHIGHLYENREAANIGNIVTELPLAYRALLSPHRVVTVL